ncbi:MAG: hypothetical protein AAF720_15260 [Pseudomonadota bacterium]
MSGGFGGEEVKQESSWRYPLGIFLATLFLCAVFLYYYVAPSVDELVGNEPSPAISEDVVPLRIGGVNFGIPANYTVYPRDRRGGDRDEVFLYALWSTFSGYAPARRNEFIEDAPDTRRIDITLAKRTSTFSEKERIQRLYLPQTIDSRGIMTPIQLLAYDFRERPADVPTNGYSDTELFLGDNEDDETIALFCVKKRDELQSPYCWREYELTDNLTVIYRFKRPYLQEWRNIDAKVREFIDSMIDKQS